MSSINGKILTGAEIICESLIENGVDTMFGIPGGAVLPFYDALPRYPIHHVLVRHEQAGGFAADGYARIKGRPGVALGTSGPGATNLLTAIVNAQMDSVPVVFLTGQVLSSVMGSDAFQETDILGMTFASVKHSYAVFDPQDIGSVMNEAFKVAMHGRPGPVLVDITKDAMQKKAEYVPGSHRDQDRHGLSRHELIVPRRDFKEQIAELEKLLDDPNSKPVAIVGHGVVLAKAAPEVLEFCERHNIPIVSTLLGVSAVPLSHPNSLSMLGMHGEAVANYIMHEANLVFGIGIRFDDRITSDLESFKSGKHFVHIEIDPSEVDKNVSNLITFHADVKDTLKLLNKELVNKHQFLKWWAHIDDLKKKHPIRKVPESKWSAKNALSTPYIVDKISAVTNGEAIIATDVGRHQMWVPRFYDFKKPYSLLTSGGLGAMGYGMPAAMGAKFANPDREVWSISGDGSFQMNIQELGTLKQEGVNLKIAIMNDSVLGIVRQWQQCFYKENISQTVFDVIDFAEIAKAYGHGSRKVTQKDEIEDAIAEARAYNGTFLLDFRIDKDEHVYPMVPPLTPLGEQIIG